MPSCDCSKQRRAKFYFLWSPRLAKKTQKVQTLMAYDGHILSSHFHLLHDMSYHICDFKHLNVFLKKLFWSIIFGGLNAMLPFSTNLTFTFVKHLTNWITAVGKEKENIFNFRIKISKFSWYKQPTTNKINFWLILVILI